MLSGELSAIPVASLYICSYLATLLSRLGAQRFFISTLSLIILPPCCYKGQRTFVEYLVAADSIEAEKKRDDTRRSYFPHLSCHLRDLSLAYTSFQ